MSKAKMYIQLNKSVAKQNLFDMKIRDASVVLRFFHRQNNKDNENAFDFGNPMKKISWNFIFLLEFCILLLKINAHQY